MEINSAQQIRTKTIRVQNIIKHGEIFVHTSNLKCGNIEGVFNIGIIDFFRYLVFFV